MSQSPVDEDEFDQARRADSAYRKSLAHVNDLLRHGGSLSGHEANCTFLNVPGSAYATASAVTGFNFLDDARALAIVDWDHDGRLDLWATNRTAPRLRFLRNQVPAFHHFVSFRLEATQGNREAIGARIELSFKDVSAAPLVRTRRAGEGFLAQSSRWMHFGLEDHARIRQVKIHWPDGSVQTFDDVPANRHYLVKQGGQLDAWRRPGIAHAIEPAEWTALPSTERARIGLIHRLPAPRLDWNGKFAVVSTVNSEKRQPLLVNLWASWCGPCLEELSGWTSHAEALRAAGVDVVALSVDGQTANESSVEDGATRELLTKIGFPFESGVASEELLQRLRILHDLSFTTMVEMPVPTSFLFDAGGELAVIYRGPTDVDTICKDAAQLRASQEEWERAVLPLAGRWNGRLPATGLLQIPRDLIHRKQLQDALDYVTAHRERLSMSPELAKLLVWLGDNLIAAGKLNEGLGQYQAALTVDENHVLAMNNLAWQRATHPQAKIRNGAEALRYAEQATKLTRGLDPDVLDTLGASYAEVGRWKQSVQAAERAVAVAEKRNQMELAGRIRKRLQLYQQQKPYRAGG